MRLHRLTLTNYRGIAHRDLEFADNGVTVLCGANEIGKSSMIEALDLLLESKDRSAKKDVKQVKPTHADVGSEVTAEISTGPYRFVYRKRFHKKCETELTIVAPAREQLTGDEAHERVRAMLDETVDTGLWQAQRVLQASSTSAVELSGCDALSRALDVAASDSAAGLSGAEPLLVEKIDAEYARYFTATGKPTGEWAAAIDQLRAADDEVARCAAAVAEVEERVRNHAALSDELVEITELRQPAAQRHAAAEDADKAVAAITDELGALRARAAALEAASGAAAVAHRERVRLREDVETRARAVTAADSAAEVAAAHEATGREVVGAADEALAAAGMALCAGDELVVESRRVVARLAQRDESRRLEALLGRIDAAQRELDEVTAQLSSITLTDKVFRQIEAAASAVEVVRAQVDSASVTVDFTAEDDLELVVGGRRITLGAGQAWSVTAAEATEVRLPGSLSVRVEPGATTVGTQAKLTAAQHHLAEVLAAGGVADVDDARLVEQRRRDLAARRDQLTATLAGIRGDDDVDALRARLAALRTDDAYPSVEAEAARAQLAAAEEALTEAAARRETQRKVASAAAAQLVERSTSAAVARDRAAAASAELAAAAQRLADGRAAVPDDDLAAGAESAAHATRSAHDQVAALSARLAEAAPDAVAAELAAARSAAESLGRRHDEVAQALHDIDVELTVFGTEGRTGKLDAAQVRREHANAEYARIQSRARAVSLLRSVMTRHRDNTRLRYVEPFRAEVQRLGRTVFGPTFEVEVDSDLQIRNRTLDGRTVPYESLSGGAREQMGIVARLAVAALVADEDTVPVMIDDALGFSDPDRLAKMGAVFDQVGAGGQVIILTCSPERYDAVTGAHRVHLTA